MQRRPTHITFSPTPSERQAVRREWAKLQLLNPRIIPKRLKKRLGTEIRLPQFLIADPGAFYWALSKGLLTGYVGFAAWELDLKARHIKPPRSKAASWGFACKFNSDKELVGIYIAKKSNRDKLKPGYQFVKHLDLSWVSVRGPSGDKPKLKLLRRIRKWYFGGKRPSSDRCCEFFENEKNFDLRCRETHFPKIARVSIEYLRH